MGVSEEELKLVLDVIANSTDKTDKDITEALCDLGIEVNRAINFSLFTPIIFFRLMKPDLHFPESYILVNKNVEVKFKEDDFFVSLYAKCEEVIRRGVNGNFILNIAARSAEFKVVNELLLQGSKVVEGVEFTLLHVVK